MMLLWLLGCHGLGKGSVTMGTPAALPLVRTSIDRRWYVPFEAPDGPWVFFFDTGYSYTTCDDGFIEALGALTHGKVRVRGEVGTLTTTKATLPPFELGGHRWDHVGCQVRDLHRTSSIRDAKEVRVAGVIGMDLLRDFVVEMDPVQGEIWLVPPGEHAPVEGIRMRRELGVGPRVKIPVQIGEHTLHPVLDTGASGSHLDLEGLGRTPDRVREGVVVRGTGHSGKDLRTMKLFEVSDLSLGALKLPVVEVAGRRKGPELLGLDVLGQVHAVYDFPRRRVIFQPIEPTPVLPWRDWWDIREGWSGSGMLHQVQ